ncbi:MAG: hypothetical protein F4Z25_01525 [Chloroflexi bacterium]|nr:hypothetical protein [Chloroflexota bacterium]
MSARLDLPAALAALAEQRPVFHSEADFQFALAWVIREHHPRIEVRLERPVTLDGRRGHVDIWVRDADGEKAIELKYWVREGELTVAGESFQHRGWAGDIERCGLWKDVARIERLIGSGLAGRGFVIGLANLVGCWVEPRREWERTNDAAFRLHEGRRVGGTLDWAEKTAASTRSLCSAPVTLRGSYLTRWREFSMPEPGLAGGEFRYLLLDVGAALGAS